MSIIDFVKKQFIDVIDWTETESGVLVYRYPMQDREIQSGAMLTVRESQLAVLLMRARLPIRSNRGSTSSRHKHFPY
jgi:membrane protease subunit (stomatin/prohibitin family)